MALPKSNAPKKCSRNCKQCRPWSDFSFRSSLIWVCTVCPDLSVQKLRIIRVTYPWHYTRVDNAHLHREIMESSMLNISQVILILLPPAAKQICLTFNHSEAKTGEEPGFLDWVFKLAEGGSICAVWTNFPWNSPWKWNDLGSRGGSFEPPEPPLDELLQNQTLNRTMHVHV